VSSVDLNRYAGKWYEIASFPQRFQKGCTCTTAEYSPTDDGYIEVLNSCRKDSINGKLSTAKGKAFIEPGSGNARLKVQFFWPFRGKYWIIDLADDYSYAVVGHPNREYLWILARQPHMDSAVYNGIIERVRENGFDIRRLNKTIQP
jgi:apolipoprotein D and lipocalin family protein